MGALAVVVSALKPTSLKGVCTKEHVGNDCLGSDQDRAGLESGQLPPMYVHSPWQQQPPPHGEQH